MYSHLLLSLYLYSSTYIKLSIDAKFHFLWHPYFSAQRQARCDMLLGVWEMCIHMAIGILLNLGFRFDKGFQEWSLICALHSLHAFIAHEALSMLHSVGIALMSCRAARQIEFNTPIGPMSVYSFANIYFRCVRIALMTRRAVGRIDSNTPWGPVFIFSFVYMQLQHALPSSHAYIAWDALTIQQAVRIALMSRRAVRHGWTFSHMFCPDWRVLLSPHELLGLPPWVVGRMDCLDDSSGGWRPALDPL